MALKTNKRLLYVGGLAEEVTEEVLRDAFIPFGDLLDVSWAAGRRWAWAGSALDGGLLSACHAGSAAAGRE